jgi:hypothetical protein
MKANFLNLSGRMILSRFIFDGKIREEIFEESGKWIARYDTTAEDGISLLYFKELVSKELCTTMCDRELREGASDAFEAFSRYEKSLRRETVK